ncbi:hypothetical protein Tco_1033137 [Tanacetum coccineum]|uniref:Uncharacterized protein n=1 Tax=Tanacetum coccineum TaxID=301880 RepID=A0ABQ5GEG0_9ASTR
MSSKDAVKEGSDSKSDDTTNLTGSRVESSRKKKLKKFDFVTEDGDHVYLTKEQIKEQKRIEEYVKAEAAKHEVEVRKEELVDLLGPDVVSKYYKAKLQYDKYCDKMLNIRTNSRITNCDVLTRKGPITQKDPLDMLNDLANKKKKHVDDIHDYFKANKRLKSSVYLVKLNTVQLESLKKLQLQFLEYLEDQDHLHFSLCSGSETKEDLSKSFSSSWLTIPS